MAMRDKPGEPGRYAIRDNPSVKAPGSTKSSGASASRAWFTSAMSTIAAPSVSFDALQRRFARLFQDRDPLDLDDGTVVVVPSLTFPVAELRKIVAIQHYEERLLYLLLLLGRPGVHVVYLTSLPIEEAVVDYYLSFLPDALHARRRLHVLAVGDPEPRPLTAKVLERPDMIGRVREVAGDPAKAFLLPFTVTPLE